jgi:hypothetical protein
MRIIESVEAVLKAQEIMRATKRWNDRSCFCPAFFLTMGIQTEQPYVTIGSTTEEYKKRSRLGSFPKY